MILIIDEKEDMVMVDTNIEGYWTPVAKKLIKSLA